MFSTAELTAAWWSTAERGRVRIAAESGTVEQVAAGGATQSASETGRGRLRLRYEAPPRGMPDPTPVFSTEGQPFSQASQVSFFEGKTSCYLSSDDDMTEVDTPVSRAGSMSACALMHRHDLLTCHDMMYHDF